MNKSPKITVDKILAKFEAGVRDNWPRILEWLDEKKWGPRYDHLWVRLQLGHAKEPKMINGRYTARGWLEDNWDDKKVQRRTARGWRKFIYNWVDRAYSMDRTSREKMGGHARDREKLRDRATDFQPVNKILAEIAKRKIK